VALLNHGQRRGRCREIDVVRQARVIKNHVAGSRVGRDAAAGDDQLSWSCPIYCSWRPPTIGVMMTWGCAQINPLLRELSTRLAIVATRNGYRKISGHGSVERGVAMSGKVTGPMTPVTLAISRWFCHLRLWCQRRIGGDGTAAVYIKPDRGVGHI